jgi:hypothetical protein
VLPRRATARLIQESNELVYFDHMAVTRRYRKTGICTAFVKFAAAYLGCWPELDIRHQSTVAQRVASNLGYSKVGRSDRYHGCALWLMKEARESPQSSLVVKRRVFFPREGGLTEVLYLGYAKEGEVSTGAS